MSRLVVGPFNRVEGDLEVRLDLADGRVRSAEVSAPLYRGFEPMLIGRVPEDALAIEAAIKEFMDKDAVNEILKVLPTPMAQDVMNKGRLEFDSPVPF